MPVMPVMPVMSLSNLSPGCFPTRLSFALTGVALAVGTQGGKGLDLKGAKAGTAKLQLAATGFNHQNAGFISFPYFSFTCRLVGIGSRAWREIGLPQVRMTEHLKFEGFQSAGRDSRVQ